MNAFTVTTRIHCLATLSRRACHGPFQVPEALTREQAGHLRHFHNLANQPDGEWRHMGTQDPMQEFLDAYRYQLATMAYATAATHFHHHNALRGV
jgi:hypothetical protein